MSTFEARPKPPAQLDSRMVKGGVDFLDYLELQKRVVNGGEDWPNTCEEIGDRHFNYALAELEKNHIETARFFFMAAQNVYRVGQYGFTEFCDNKKRLYDKLLLSFEKSLALNDFPTTKVAIDYKNYEMDGWLLKPNKMREDKPIVIMLPGATGFKEEFYQQSLNMLERGISVLLMDGPGQGSTLYYNNGYLEVEIENAYVKMLDYIESLNEFGNIGIVGGSTGGYYVPRVAAIDNRIKVCVANSGSYYPQEICNFVPMYHHKFAVLCGVSDEEMHDLWPKMTLEGIAEKITCPLLIVHSDTDPVFSLKGMERLYNEASSTDKELKLYNGTWHCQAGAETEAFRYMADFVADRL